MTPFAHSLITRSAARLREAKGGEITCVVNKKANINMMKPIYMLENDGF